MSQQRGQYALDPNYNDVASRIAEFREKYPAGTLQQRDLQFIDFAGGSWVVFTAAAYRDPDDQRPGEGTAWEPVPGRTPFTRDSEVQNAETAAWGRAIVATLAADMRKGIASADEVQSRRETPSQGKSPADPLLAAKSAVHAAWLTRHQRFDRDEMRADFEAFAAVSLEDADAEALFQYAEHVRGGGDA